MFRTLFRNRNRDAELAEQKAATFIAAVDKAGAENPLAPLRIGGRELTEFLLNGMKDEHGVHIESLLGVLGSLGGFCCVDSTLKQAIAMGQDPRDCGIIDIETSDGQRFYTGNHINYLLGEAETSLWALVAGMVNHLGSQDYPDFGEIAGHVAGTFGTGDFGIPRLPDNHQLQDLPINYVQTLWPVVLPLVEKRAPALKDRVILFGFAIQNAIEMGKDVIPPSVAGKLVMECAVPMSRIDPSRI